MYSDSGIEIMYFKMRRILYFEVILCSLNYLSQILLSIVHNTLYAGQPPYTSHRKTYYILRMRNFSIIQQIEILNSGTVIFVFLIQSIDCWFYSLDLKGLYFNVFLHSYFRFIHYSFQFQINVEMMREMVNSLKSSLRVNYKLSEVRV